ncbi:MAG: hypothetical protein P4N24_09860 [Acidobacteriota bacterium]|nr:hypothetical protein [Acidobacteriota bacterium]
MSAMTPTGQIHLSEDRKREALEELARILKSDFFRGSRNCCRFLEYSVLHTLQGNAQSDIRERIVGVEVFDRPPSYNASEDPIVRVTANDVRKRLAQFYTGANVENNPVISLPPGSYAATFTWKPSVPEPMQATPLRWPRAWRPGKITIATLVPLALLVAGFIYFQTAGRDAVETNVWSPVLRDSRTVLICVAQPLAYSPATGLDASNPATQGKGGSTSEASKVLPVQFIPMPGAFVGVADAHALADIVSFLGKHGKSWHLSAGDSTPSAELRDGPVVLIGVYDNPWTRRLTQDLPFVFQTGNTIRDQAQPGKEWHLKQTSADWCPPEDLAVVSRFISSETGQPVMVAAGVSNIGTQTAGEFLTSPDLLSDALQDAPKGWQKKNFQFVLYTKVLGRTPGPPVVVAKRFW